jgi:hypothetical protein
MSRNISGGTELPVLILSIVALAIAGGLSIITISNGSDRNEISGRPIRSDAAGEAARAGLEAAKWHIECHGRSKAGSLGPHFYINGATYTVCWSDMNMQDSTVMVQSVGNFAWGIDRSYRVNLESKIKIDFLPAHRNMILSSYYSENRNDIFDSFSQ